MIACFLRLLSQEYRKIEKCGSRWWIHSEKCLSDAFHYLDILNLYLQGDKTIVNTSKKLDLFQVFLLSAVCNCWKSPVSQSWIVLAHCQPKHPMQCQDFWSSSRIVQLTNIKIFTSFKPTMLLHQNVIFASNQEQLLLPFDSSVILTWAKSLMTRPLVSQGLSRTS